MNWIVSIIGVLVGAAIVMLIERQRKPNLSLNIGYAGETDWGENQNPRYVKVLEIGVKNSQLCHLLRPFMHRNAAVHCYGNVFFYEQSGEEYTRIFNKIDVKWTSLPATQIIHSKILKGFTPYEVKYNDIHPGETELIDIAAKYDDDEDCYVWCYDSYKCLRLKNPELRIPNKECFVYMDIRFAGQHLIDVFKMINGKSREQFELKNISSQQKKRIKEIHRGLTLDAKR